MTVDLLSDLPADFDAKRDFCCVGRTSGVVVFQNGDKMFSLHVAPDENGEIEVRIEHGVYYGYDRDGRICNLVNGHWQRRPDNEGPQPRDIVEFVRCSWEDPRAKGLPTQVTP